MPASNSGSAFTRSGSWQNTAFRPLSIDASSTHKVPILLFGRYEIASDSNALMVRYGIELPNREVLIRLFRALTNSHAFLDNKLAFCQLSWSLIGFLLTFLGFKHTLSISEFVFTAHLVLGLCKSPAGILAPGLIVMALPCIRITVLQQVW